MKVFSICELCRLGLLTRAPLCFGCGKFPACASRHVYPLKPSNKELSL